MTDDTARAPGATPGEPDSALGSQAAGGPNATAEPAVDLAQAAADLKDRLLRALAEMENLRRRTEREVADARSYGISSFARDLLAVVDNMRRALDAVGADVRDNADEGVKALLEGVELTERELLKALEKHGVKKLDPQGGRFDPHLHQAMYEVPDASVPAGTVVQVVQPGYLIGERVLRPALVAVAKGGPKSAPANGGDSNKSSTAPADGFDSRSN